MRYASTEDTIAAISTPRGEGGIGIVRLSGPSSLQIASKMFVSSRGRNILKDTRRVFHGHVSDPSGQRIDEVLLHIMRAPHSYTAEDVAEINAHGGMAPLQAILEEALRLGARLAQPGEFTQRAFINGRLDLTRAEAVMDLVGAKTRTALNAANAASGGVLARALAGLRETLADALARIEAAVDFPEDDLPELVDAALIHRLERAQEEMKRLIASADAGLRIREGVSIAIVGRPNVGKSSLFNALLRDARAIVSPEPGTTRDRIEETVALGGVPVRLIDTAGMRDTPHSVELMGVTLARRAAQQADYILFVVDAAEPCTEADTALAAELTRLETPIVLVRNKIDLTETRFTPPDAPFKALCDISALTGAGLERFEEQLTELLQGDAVMETNSPMLSRTHQKDSMRRASTCLDRLLANTAASPELSALELREALQALGEITGETTPEHLLDRIFASFCIGK
ncbi:MAG TPA: tRNA uridine-5-carboxymethylaminomethyl(34) synthesis GTPase MnmE [Candidatus Hydrogenedentes bacterium]|nr:MAG: tRNA modification GTPase MnmE [Candidatus Hydrogenedentes bacterium ADurb.Bin179]HOH28275.1 tRNA uridine-5-carboxymethylaminomethyl(34) synthesis GTPase MnmE [Candidatus Hydrogenedentota bacterium]